MKHYFGILPIIFSLLAGCSGEKSAHSAKAAETPPAIEVFIVRATQASPSVAYSAPSTLAVEHEADLLAEEQGRLLVVLADQGQRVKRGQVLARIDDSRLRKLLDQDGAELKTQEVKAREAEVLRQGAEVELQRQTELRGEGLGSLRDYDRARFNLEAIRQEGEAARYAFERARHKVGEDELRLSRMELKAPFDGVVARRYARLGQMLLQNDRVLRVTELRPLLVRFTVPESLRRAVSPGSVVEVVPSGQVSGVRARVIRTGYVVDAASGTLECTTRLLDPVPESLVPGMSVETKVFSGTPESAIWIPSSSLLPRSDGGGEVYAVVADRLQRRSVRLGQETSAGVQVLGGLSPGDRIALRATEKLRDGLMVRVASTTP